MSFVQSPPELGNQYREDRVLRSYLRRRRSPQSRLIERALPHYLSRDPARLWISGQWMAENIGGSDISGTETVARQDPNGRWRLHGRKWFTSAINADTAFHVPYRRTARPHPARHR